ncbi:MAG: NAD(P)-dependent oxidoreductase, partial [Chitinophagaceae bacterium]
MKDRVLITGASGFVGYHLVEQALENNLEVFAAIRKSSKIDHLKELDIHYIYPDFSNQASLQKMLEDNQINYIIHASGITKARTPSEYGIVNTKYTVNLALAALDAKTDFKKFVFVSSLAAVGPLAKIEGMITEKTTPHPVTAYGRSKLVAEEKLAAIKGLNYTILRPTAVYGPRDRDIFIFFKQVKKGLEFHIGRNAQKLSFIYVKDLAKASIKALYMGEKKAYNLSDGNFYDRYQLAEISKSVLNLTTFKFHLPVNFVKVIALIAEKVSSLSNKASALNIEKLN